MVDKIYIFPLLALKHCEDTCGDFALAVIDKEKLPQSVIAKTCGIVRESTFHAVMEINARYAQDGETNLLPNALPLITWLMAGDAVEGLHRRCGQEIAAILDALQLTPFHSSVARACMLADRHIIAKKLRKEGITKGAAGYAAVIATGLGYECHLLMQTDAAKEAMRQKGTETIAAIVDRLASLFFDDTD